MSVDDAYESYCAWAGDEKMPEGVFAMMREAYPQVSFAILHRWYLTPQDGRTSHSVGRES